MWYSIRMLNYPSIIRLNDKNFPSEPSFGSRTFELFQLASVRTFKQHVRTPFSVWQVERFLSKTQIWEDSDTCPDDVCSRPDAILDKASRAKEVQPSKCQTLWSGRSYLVMKIACSGSATVRTLGQHRSNTFQYFDHNILFKYRIGTKSASLES